jgi:AhpD family alkylhydroperoxidase
LRAEGEAIHGHSLWHWIASVASLLAMTCICFQAAILGLDRNEADPMARIPYADLDDEALQPLVRQIARERGEVLQLYRMLLHSPPVAEGWLKLLTAVRQQTTLPGTLRELIILRIAVINRAIYEFEQHKPIAIKEGVSAEKIASLPQWEARADLYSDEECAALALTDQITRQVHVDETLWRTVRDRWSERQLVELVVTIASYNMVSRVLEALEIR